MRLPAILATEESQPYHVIGYKPGHNLPTIQQKPRCLFPCPVGIRVPQRSTGCRTAVKYHSAVVAHPRPESAFWAYSSAFSASRARDPPVRGAWVHSVSFSALVCCVVLCAVALAWRNVLILVVFGALLQVLACDVWENLGKWNKMGVLCVLNLSPW